MAGEGHRNYAAFGLAWRSCMALPFRETGAGRPDVVIRFGEVPASLPPPAKGSGLWQAAPGAFLLRVAGLAHFYVRNGREILIAADGGDDRAIVACLTGPVVAALLQQRQVATLHGGALELPGGAAAVFLGSTAVGKSSLLAALNDRGYALLADGLTGTVLTGGQLVVLPAFPALRLWADALDQLDWWGRPIVRMREPLEKYEVQVRRFRATPARLRACYVLQGGRSEEVSVEAWSSVEALRGVIQHGYRNSFLHGAKLGAGSFLTLSRMVRQAPTFRVARALEPFRIGPLADAVESHLETVSAQGQSPTQADAHPCPSSG